MEDYIQTRTHTVNVGSSQVGSSQGGRLFTRGIFFKNHFINSIIYTSCGVGGGKKRKKKRKEKKKKRSSQGGGVFKKKEKKVVPAWM